MLRSEKTEVVENLKDMFLNNSAVVLAHYHGLTVDQMTSLRNKMRESGVKMVVAKNTLAKIAVQGTSFADLERHLGGPTAIAASNDPVAVTKIINSFSEENEQLKLIGAVVDGRSIDLAGIKQIAKMPSLDDLRAKIIGLLKAPASSIASIIAAPAGKVARVISAYSQTSK